MRHLKNNKRYYLLPGGGQNAFETAKEAAARELKEELNISAQDFKLLFIRESMSEKEQRHIQFLVFEAINPDLSHLKTGVDKRVEGFEFFLPEEINDKTVYPQMKQDIINCALGKSTELFKTLEWAA